MDRRTVLFSLGALAVGAAEAGDALAQVPPPMPTSGGGPPPTLRGLLAALPQSQQPRGGVWIVPRPDILPGNRPGSIKFGENSPTTPPDLSTFDGVARVFGYNRVRFGDLFVLAPETMVVLNTDPKLMTTPPLAVLAGKNPLPVLLGDLSDGQFRQLLGGGLSIGSLAPEQFALLRAALPEKAEYGRPGPQNVGYDESTLQPLDSRKLRSARLKLFRNTSFSFDVVDQPGYGVGARPGIGGWNGDGWTLRDNEIQFFDRESDPARLLLRQVVPTRFKKSELGFDSPALAKLVSLGDAKSFREILARVSSAIGLTLYSDPALGEIPVMILGEPNKPVAAREILRAITLSSCGAWRRVDTDDGPLWLLTHETIGRARLFVRQHEIVGSWARRLQESALNVAKRLETMKAWDAIPYPPGDPAALPPGLWNRPGATLAELPPSIANGLRADLAKNLQAMIRQRDDPNTPPGMRDSSFLSTLEKVQGSLTDKSPVRLNRQMQFALEIPGVGIVALGSPKQVETIPPENPGAPPPAPPDIKIPLPETTRATLAFAHGPESARALVDRAAAAGLNALYLMVFAGGRPYFETRALPGAGGDAAKTLSAAIERGREKGIAVHAALDLLCWRNDMTSENPLPLPGGFFDDPNIPGETARQTIDRRVAENSFENPYVIRYAKKVAELGWVSPTSPRVRRALISLVKDLATVDGLAGIVFQRTAPMGYLRLPYYPGIDDLEFGYSTALRAARIRAGDGDPIDIGGVRYASLGFQSSGDWMSFDVGVPGFDFGLAGRVDAWQEFRARASETLLAELFDAIRLSSPTLPLRMRERTIGFTFDPWTDGRKPNAVKDLSADADEIGKRANAATEVIVGVDSGKLSNPAWLKDEIESMRKEAGRGRSKGIVLDLYSDDAARDAVASLEILAKSVAPKGTGQERIPPSQGRV